MDKRRFSLLRTKPQDREFHRSRIMFCIKDNKIEIAPVGTTNSHLEWFEKNGWVTTEYNTEQFLKKNIRGFYLPSENSLYCYRGIGFWFDGEVFFVIKSRLPEFKEAFNLNNDTKIFFGLKDSPVHNVEYTRYYAGTLREML